MNKNLKRALMTSLVLINFVVLGYLYFELQQLKGQGSTQLKTQGSTQQVESINNLKAKNEELTNRITKLEGVFTLLGNTLGLCEFYYEALPKFGPSSGYGTQLNQCFNAYKKFVKESVIK